MTIGILTSGGDCQALNAAMRGLAKGLYKNISDIEILGFKDGYKGLEYNNFIKMNSSDFDGILNQGGTILGSSRMPFKQINEPESDGKDKVNSMIANYKKNNLDCLVVLGGNGSHKTANLLSEKGLNIVTLPKTIDNDIYGTDMTFGFMSAVEIAAKSIECIRTTAESHSRIFIVEIMGHKTGWLTLNAGIAGGADVILLPEIPYDEQKILNRISENEIAGKKWTVIACAEGAISVEDINLSKKALKQKYLEMPVSMQLASRLREMTGKEVRITVPGHMQRGGAPVPYDKVLASRLGARAADFIINKKYGVMAALKNGEIIPLPLNEVAGKLKAVPSDCSIVAEAKSIGISFGN